MHAQLINGKDIAARHRKKIAEMIQRHKDHSRPPGLAVIWVGSDPASALYVKNKKAACDAVGIYSVESILPASITQAALLTVIDQYNKDPQIDGILVQLPLPAHIHTDDILEKIDPAKDVDGFHPYNLGRLAQRRPLFRSCTSAGVMTLLHEMAFDLKGLHATVIGTSNIVGRPMALELIAADCTVTLCHRYTQHLSDFVRQADLLISAVGQPNLVKGEWIKPGAIVIDVGIKRLGNGDLVGDIEFDKAKTRAGWITPVPGGVGPMTVTMLLENTVLAWLHQKSAWR